MWHGRGGGVRVVGAGVMGGGTGNAVLGVVPGTGYGYWATVHRVWPLLHCVWPHLHCVWPQLHCFGLNYTVLTLF